jgi:hypothetical protein
VSLLLEMRGTWVGARDGRGLGLEGPGIGVGAVRVDGAMVG